MPRWLRLIVLGAALLFAASFVLSRALRLSSARRYLTAHLAASFGRPVDVSSFDFSLLDGARIEAHQVTVSEDPHFGNEYFLRADTVAASLRWTALLGGRFEFGSVSLARPSLNLVRDVQGEWNIEHWLPPPSAPVAPPGFVGPMAPWREVRATRPTRVRIDGGRVNFKRGDDKVPFALADVSGSVEQNAAGRWQLDVEARPMRAGVELQDIGTVRLRGSVAGTTARLQPAELTIAWRAASLADALRFASLNDYGIRGELAVDLDAHIGASAQDSAASAAVAENPTGQSPGGAQWSVSGVARLTGIHGWRLAQRSIDPAVNLSLDADWRLGQPRVGIRKLLVEMPASRVEGAGDVDWSRGVRPELHLANSTLALRDVLSWYKALRPDVNEDLQASGTLGLVLRLAGWPLELQDGAITSSGGTLTAKTAPALLKVGVLRANISRGKIDLSPTEISFAPAASTGNDAVQAAPAPRNLFVVRGSITSPANNAGPRWPPDWSVSIEGATSRVQDWLALSNSLAQPINSGWTALGSLAVKVRGECHADASMPPAWTGTMDFQALTLSPSYVNQPLLLSKTHVDFAPTQRAITISSAEAFGTTWRGSLARKYSDPQWSFDLVADRLDATELDRWLGPRARPGFLARIIGADSGAASGPNADAPVTRLAARGRLRAASMSVPPLQIENVDTQAELAGRAIRIRGAQGDFFGGQISGSFDAQLLRTPSYEFQGRFDRVNLALLGRAVPSLTGRIAGTASATLNLSAHGIGREELVGSLEGQGTLNGRDVLLRGVDLSTAIQGNDGRAPDTFTSMQGNYRVRDKSVDLVDFVMDHASGRLMADGRVDFSHALNIRLRSAVMSPAAASAADPPQNFVLGGTLESPSVVLASAVPNPPARAGSR